MNKKITLDLNSINVVSFDTATDIRIVKGADFAATAGTGGFCCVDTECVTKIECSTNTCP